MDSTGSALFGLWQAGSIAQSFSLDTSSPGVREEKTLWRQDLPEDLAAAHQALAVQEADLLVASAALETVPARLDRLVHQTRQIMAAEASGGLAFAAPPPGPEAELLALIEAGPRQTSTGAASFGGIDLFGREIDPAAAVAQFRGALEQVQRVVFHLAWVETRSGGIFLAQTILGWSGDSDTSWRSDIAAEKAMLHEMTIRNAVRSRLNLLRSLAILGQGAVLISSLVTTPAGAILALPAIWRFINQVLAEVRHHGSPQPV